MKKSLKSYDSNTGRALGYLPTTRALSPATIRWNRFKHELWALFGKTYVFNPVPEVDKSDVDDSIQGSVAWPGYTEIQPATQTMTCGGLTSVLPVDVSTPEFQAAMRSRGIQPYSEFNDQALAAAYQAYVTYMESTGTNTPVT